MMMVAQTSTSTATATSSITYYMEDVEKVVFILFIYFIFVVLVVVYLFANDLCIYSIAMVGFFVARLLLMQTPTHKVKTHELNVLNCSLWHFSTFRSVQSLPQNKV